MLIGLQKLGVTLVDLGFTTDENIAEALSKQLNIPRIRLSDIKIDENVLGLVDEKMLRKYMLMPYGFDEKNPNILCVVLSCCQHNAEVIVFIDVKQHRLHLTIGAFRQHIKEIGKKVVGVICLFPDRHRQANWLAVVVLTISEHIFPGIRLLQYASLHVMNINLTLSHSQVA